MSDMSKTFATPIVVFGETLPHQTIGELQNINSGKTLSNTCMFFTTPKEGWESYGQTNSKVRDAAQIYEIKTKISSTKQGNHLVIEYAQILQNLWQDLDHYHCIEIKCSNDATLLTFYGKREDLHLSC